MAKKTITTTCHQCGGEMVRNTRLVTYEYHGQSISLSQPGLYCRQCDEGVLTGADIQATEAAFAAFKARVDGVLGAAEIARIRKRLRLSQRRAGELLGGGVRAFQKYEKGTSMASVAMSNLLRLLDKDPARLTDLLAATAPAKRRGLSSR